MSVLELRPSPMIRVEIEGDSDLRITMDDEDSVWMSRHQALELAAWILKQEACGWGPVQ